MFFPVPWLKFDVMDADNSLLPYAHILQARHFEHVLHVPLPSCQHRHPACSAADLLVKVNVDHLQTAWRTWRFGTARCTNLRGKHYNNNRENNNNNDNSSTYRAQKKKTKKKCNLGREITTTKIGRSAQLVSSVPGFPTNFWLNFCHSRRKTFDLKTLTRSNTRFFCFVVFSVFGREWS